MSFGNLSAHFAGIATKRLTSVDTKGSNQHEVGGPKDQWNRFRQILGSEPRLIAQNTGIPTRFIYIEGEQECFQSEGHCSWYDTRHKDPKRTAEWRVYYKSNDVTRAMRPGDHLFLAKLHDDYLFFIVVAEDSGLSERLMFLFGLEGHSDSVVLQDFSQSDPELDFLNRLLLEEIGIEFEDPLASKHDEIIERYGFEFPSTREFSDLARLTLPEVCAIDDPDRAILLWLEHEESLFKRLEARIVTKRLAEGWDDSDGFPDVDGFIKFSLSVQNRRKSRMGHSFENHLVAVFNAWKLDFDEQKKTEKGKKPDFLFPSIADYENPEFPVSLLTMLAAKSTCKDRWSQILPEAERIPRKHLVTLERSISEAQTKTMRESNVQLVVPKDVQKSYSNSQREWVWSLSDFVESVLAKQERVGF